MATAAVARGSSTASTPTPRTSDTRRPSLRCARARSSCPQGCRCSGAPRLACTEIELLDALATHHDLQVQVVVGGERVEEFDLRAGQPGVPEQRQPGGMRALAQRSDGLLVSDVKGVRVDAVDESTRQPRRLPLQVVVEAVASASSQSTAAAAAGARTTRTGREPGGPQSSAALAAAPSPGLPPEK